MAVGGCGPRLCHDARVFDPVAGLAAPISGIVFGLTDGRVVDVDLERPAVADHGDYATGVAMRLAPVIGRAPREIAAEIAERIEVGEEIEAVEIAGPGFINLRLGPAWYRQALAGLGRVAMEEGPGRAATAERVLVEFVSSNPTGDLTIGSARNAAIGDCLARLLVATGDQVTREYYLNDAGRQVRLFGASVRARRLGQEPPEDGYPGEELIDIAREIAVADDAPEADWVEPAVAAMTSRIGTSLERMRVTFDVWTSERSLHDGGAVLAAITRARAEGYVFDREGAVWLQTSAFGDDKDRVLIKADGEPTYFAADLAYLQDKFDRGFERLVYVLGADHHGYVQRLKAAAACLGHAPEAVEIVIYQLVTVSGERMGKRRGNVITLDGLVDAIGVDAARYFLVQRSHDQTLDIDLDLAVEASNANPVYYVQYAHARCCSILRKAEAEGVARGVVDGYDPERGERTLIKRLVEWPDVLRQAAERRAPHRIPAWLHELAADFHAFHHDHLVLHADPAVRTFRLDVVDATRVALERGLALIGVDAPERM